MIVKHAVLVGADLVRLLARGKLRTAFQLIKSYAYRSQSSVLLIKIIDGHAYGPPTDLQFHRIAPAQAGGFSTDVAAVSNELSNFRRGCDCYLAYVDQCPCAVGWRFQHSRLLRRLGYRSTVVYLGGFTVRPEFRGRGIYPALLQMIAADLADSGATRLALEIAPDNAASLRGAYKAGFDAVGVVQANSVFGVILQCKLKNDELEYLRPSENDPS